MVVSPDIPLAQSESSGPEGQHSTDGHREGVGEAHQRRVLGPGIHSTLVHNLDMETKK